MSHASFLPPCRAGRGGEGSGCLGYPSERGCFRRLLGCPTAWLMLRCLAVVARRAQRTQTLERVRVRHTPSHQLASAQREMVSNIGRATTQHAPRVGIQVGSPDAWPPPPVRTATRCAPRTVRLTLMSRTATTTGQLGAPGDRARGAGLTRHGGTSFKGWGVALRQTGLREKRQTLSTSRSCAKQRSPIGLARNPRNRARGGNCDV